MLFSNFPPLTFCLVPLAVSILDAARPAASLLAESPTFSPIKLQPASLEDFRRILLQYYASKSHARALKVRVWYMVE